MRIPFNSSPEPTLGIEVELELIDATTGLLASAASEVISDLAGGTAVHPKVKHELLECTVEMITGICTTVDEARSDLAATLVEVTAAARSRGLEVICSGTHPFSSWRDQTISPDPRYARLVEEMQWMARRLQIFGVHIHVGVSSGEKAVAVANALTAYIPHFLSLSASSPFWEGEDTGLASARSKVFEGLPTAGLPAPVDSWSDFERYLGTLKASESLQSVREVWWDIRPHPTFGTIELRMCDGIPTLREVSAVAALAQCLVVHLGDRFEDNDEPKRLPRWVLVQNKWRAGRYGLDAELIIDDDGRRQPIKEAIGMLLEDLTATSHRLGCSAELSSVESILHTGASYQRQRAAARPKVGGSIDLGRVVDLLIAEMATDEPGAALSKSDPTNV